MKKALVALLALSACATPDASDAPMGIAMPRTSLHVETMPAGATASIAYGDVTRPHVLSCITPCDLSVPQAQSFRFQVEREGYVVLPYQRPQWRAGVMGWRLEPSTVSATLQER